MLVKPSSTEGFKRRFKRQAFRCETAAEVEDAYEQAEPYEPMVQEVIPGGDDELYTLGSYLREDGEALGLFSGRKLRQTPPGVGTCRVGEALWVDEVVDQGLKLLRALSFHGLSQVELKRDPRDGAFKLMEVNPRLFQWHGLAAACGVDLPLIAYRDLTGERVEPVSANGSHKRWAITLLAGRVACAAAAALRRRRLRARRPQARARPGRAPAAPVKLRAWLFAPALLALSRLLPASGFGLGLRLGAATLVFLIPGAFLSRALGVRGFSGALAWTMAILFGATALTFAVHASLWLTLVLLLVAALAAAPFAARRKGGSSVWTFWMIVAGLVAGITLWWVSGYDGDAFFHLARVQKLLALHDLSLRSVDEFKDGGLHPGYAFPLWHAAVAVIAKLAGVGAPSAFLHLPTVLLPLSFVLVYEAGTALFASRWAGVATALAEFALLGLASGHGGAYSRWRCRRTASRTLMLPALLALVFLYVREPSGAGSPRSRPSPAMTPRPPELLGARRDRARRLPARARAARPAPRRRAHRRRAGGDRRPGRARGRVAAADRRETASHSPSRVELNRAFAAYGHELDVSAAQLPARAGALRPRGRDRRRLAPAAARWPSSRTGGCGPPSCSARCSRPSRSRSAVRLPALRRRSLDLAGPADHWLRAAAVRARRRAARARGLPRLWVLPIALAAGIGLQLVFPGDFGAPYRLVDGAPVADLGLSSARRGRAVAAAIFGRRIPQVEGAAACRRGRGGALPAAGRRARLLALDTTLEPRGSGCRRSSSPPSAARCRAATWSSPTR